MGILDIGTDAEVKTTNEGNTEVVFDNKMFILPGEVEVMAVRECEDTIEFLNSDNLADCSERMDTTIHFFCPIWKNSYIRQFTDAKIPASPLEAFAHPTFTDTGHRMARVVDIGTVYEPSNDDDYVLRFRANAGTWRNAILLRKDNSLFSALVFYNGNRWMYLENTVKELGSLREID